MTKGLVSVEARGLTKPVTVFIKKIAEAIGGAVAPWQMKRLAKADAEVSRIAAESEIVIDDIHRRAEHRRLTEEASNQVNIERVIEKAIPLLLPTAQPGNVHNDWIVRLFSHARLVSDEHVQDWWSRILAGEVNCAGSFSLKTLNVLSNMSQSDAELFRQICGFKWDINGPHLLIFRGRHEIYGSNGVTMSRLRHVEDLGLITSREDFAFGHPGYALPDVPEIVSAGYFGRRLRIRSRALEGEKSLPIGHVLFTRAGAEIAEIAEASEVDGFWDYVKSKWASHLLDEESG